MRRSLPLAGVLLALWLLAWGEVSVANVVSGILLVVVLLVVFPSGRRPNERTRVRPLATVRLVAYRVQHPTDLTLTLMANIIALAPGTMPVDVTSDPPMIYVHFLLLSDVEVARRTLGRLEEHVVAAVGSTDARVVGTDDGGTG